MRSAGTRRSRNSSKSGGGGGSSQQQSHPADLMMMFSSPLSQRKDRRRHRRTYNDVIEQQQMEDEEEEENRGNQEEPNDDEREDEMDMGGYERLRDRFRSRGSSNSATTAAAVAAAAMASDAAIIGSSAIAAGAGGDALQPFAAAEPLSPAFIARIRNEHSSTMAVIDPKGPQTGVYTIFLPWENVYNTQGLFRLLDNKKPHPSLCMLFQRGGCRAGSRCNQVHADPDAVTRVRAEGRHDCCLFHADPPSNDQNFLQSYKAQKRDLHLLIGEKKRLRIPWDRLARTACLDRLLDSKSSLDHSVKFICSSICRLHQQEKCRYGQDCHHIHLCREFVSAHPGVKQEIEGGSGGGSLAMDTTMADDSIISNFASTRSATTATGPRGSAAELLSSSDGSDETPIGRRRRQSSSFEVAEPQQQQEGGGADDRYRLSAAPPETITTDMLRKLRLASPTATATAATTMVAEKKSAVVMKSPNTASATTVRAPFGAVGNVRLPSLSAELPTSETDTINLKTIAKPSYSSIAALPPPPATITSPGAGAADEALKAALSSPSAWPPLPSINNKSSDSGSGKTAAAARGGGGHNNNNNKSVAATAESAPIPISDKAVVVVTVAPKTLQSGEANVQQGTRTVRKPNTVFPIPPSSSTNEAKDANAPVGDNENASSNVTQRQDAKISESEMRETMSATSVELPTSAASVMAVASGALTNPAPPPRVPSPRPLAAPQFNFTAFSSSSSFFSSFASLPRTTVTTATPPSSNLSLSAAANGAIQPVDVVIGPISTPQPPSGIASGSGSGGPVPAVSSEASVRSGGGAGGGTGGVLLPSNSMARSPESPQSPDFRALLQVALGPPSASTEPSETQPWSFDAMARAAQFSLGGEASPPPPPSSLLREQSQHQQPQKIRSPNLAPISPPNASISSSAPYFQSHPNEVRSTSPLPLQSSSSAGAPTATTVATSFPTAVAGESRLLPTISAARAQPPSLPATQPSRQPMPTPPPPPPPPPPQQQRLPALFDMQHQPQQQHPHVHVQRSVLIQPPLQQQQQQQQVPLPLQHPLQPHPQPQQLPQLYLQASVGRPAPHPPAPQLVTPASLFPSFAGQQGPTAASVFPASSAAQNLSSNLLRPTGVMMGASIAAAPAPAHFAENRFRAAPTPTPFPPSSGSGSSSSTSAAVLTAEGAPLMPRSGPLPPLSHPHHQSGGITAPFVSISANPVTPFPSFIIHDEIAGRLLQVPVEANQLDEVISLADLRPRLQRASSSSLPSSFSFVLDGKDVISKNEEKLVHVGWRSNRISIRR